MAKINIEVFAERLKKLINEGSHTLTSLGEVINLSSATLSRYAAGKMSPKITTIEAIAREFNINPAWLMGYDVDRNLSNEQNRQYDQENKAYYELTKKDELDIAKELERMLEGLDSKSGFAAFDGEPLDEATRLVLKDSLERSMLLAKQIAKQKFTPKKYRN